ncbi:siderophore ferric iron reductase [Vibrio sp. 10N.261.55.A7]|uniref:siderophore ferric iron reductase n=1 Tax=Vibrio sp. 10N.261.55.A7 TaxID=1880851 RepID=UPI0010559452|nr:siderophore ferric iron reductase [Vibrio sp. 10N.261.55.A7]
MNDIQQLMDAARQVTPYLNGKVAPAETGMLLVNDDNSALLTKMYQEISRLHPEAKHAYFLTRTFSLLSWQPIYLAFIGVYGFNMIPDFSSMSQNYRNGLISGFHFDSSECRRGDKADLIAEVGQTLGDIVMYWQQELDVLYRCRPGFSRQLMADFLLMSLMKVHHHFDAFERDDVIEDAKLWLEAFQLPKQTIKGFSVESPLSYTRKSCCLVTQTKHGELCADCPKQRVAEDKQRKRSHV